MNVKKICKDVHKKCSGSRATITFVFDSKYLNQLAEFARDCVEVLKKSEWMAIDGYSGCWSCDQYQENGHIPDCELAKLFRRWEGEEQANA